MCSTLWPIQESGNSELYLGPWHEAAHIVRTGAHAFNRCQQETYRLKVRLSEREARLIRFGAEQRGLNLADYILESACTIGEHDLGESRHFELNARDWQTFSEALDRPAKVKPALRRLFSESTILDKRWGLSRERLSQVLNQFPKLTTLATLTAARTNH